MPQGWCRGGEIAVEILILLVVGVGALIAFMAGIALLVVYLRAGSQVGTGSRPLPRAGAAPCPRCGTLNPPGAPACEQCGQSLGSALPLRPAGPPPPHARAPQPMPRPSVSPIMTQGPASRPAAMPRAWLEGIGGALATQRAWLDKPDTLVGRSTACDIQVFDPKVSRRHFLIRYGRGAFYLQDQRSSHGTLINGERVMAQRLRNGDRITIGDTALTFHVES